MKIKISFFLSIISIAYAKSQQTVSQTITLTSNGLNSTEILMKKQDNINYYSLYSNNSGFGLYNSNTQKVPFHINSSDFVGIGTDTPQEKLSVNGKIRAREIQVETANWPDYVFSKDYKLPDLKETETFIKTNGHLPGVPSATVAEKEGIELGEMNKILLKKVEELTLHLIEKDKQLETEKKMNKDQENRLSTLEKIITDLKK